MMKKIPDNQISFYQSLDGSVNIEVLFAEANIWLTQKKMAELFSTTPQNITQHLGHIYTEKEIAIKTTCKEFLQVQTEGAREIKRNSTMYSLEAIIAVGYRVNSERGTQFRQWATGILKNYIHKGYALDVNRMKYGSRFSARYFEDLFAITGKTAAEIISDRVSSKKEKMGLTSWRRAPGGKIMPSDTVIAFLKFNEQEILTNAGKVSHAVAEALALGEYEVYRQKQDKQYISDFDREVVKLLENENKKSQ